MRYHLAPIFCRPWLLNGLSQRLIESHYENNYGGALRRLNAITDKLASLDFSTAPGYVVSGLKHQELVALNSTLLHELYFASTWTSEQMPRPMSIPSCVTSIGTLHKCAMRTRSGSSCPERSSRENSPMSRL
jgi:hypothetical protein